jgi:hypothetical protein
MTDDLWDFLPATDFSNPANWKRLGDDRFYALRLRLRGIKSRPNAVRWGPIVGRYPVGPGFKLTRSFKIALSETSSEMIQHTIGLVTTARVVAQMSAKIAAKIAAKTPFSSAELGAELLSKEEYDISESAQETFNTQVGRTISRTREVTTTIAYEISPEYRLEETRYLYQPERIDVYAHSYEYIEFSYRASIRNLLRKKRYEIKNFGIKKLGWPLAAIIYYQPQTEPVPSPPHVENELTNPNTIDVDTLDIPMPTGRPEEEDETLDELWRIAFPEDSAERRLASKRRISEPHRPAAGVRRGAPKKAAKKSFRKAMAKKTMRKAPMKRPTLKRAMKKTSAKRTPAKRR